MVNGFKSKVYFIGIGGISMSAIARILHREGHFVGGSDRVESEVTDKLLHEGIKVSFSHKASNVSGYDCVVYSSAINNDDPELKSAISLGKQVLSRAEALSKLSQGYEKNICICGSHGKTTTTAIIGEMVAGSVGGLIHIGGESVNFKDNLIVSGENKNFFVTEACEYKDNFLKLRPDIAVVLNISKDHMDYFKTEKNLINSFKAFLFGVKPGGFVVANIDCENVRRLCEEMPTNINIITFSKYNQNADYYLQNIENLSGQGYKFKINKFSEDFILSIGGEHNLYNALASVIVGNIININKSIIKKKLKS